LPSETSEKGKKRAPSLRSNKGQKLQNLTGRGKIWARLERANRDPPKVEPEVLKWKTAGTGCSDAGEKKMRGDAQCSRKRRRGKMGMAASRETAKKTT